MNPLLDALSIVDGRVVLVAAVGYGLLVLDAIVRSPTYGELDQ